MSRLRFFSCAFSVAGLAALLTLPCLRAEGQILTDDFNTNTINPCLWSTGVVGDGSSIGAINQELEINHAANAHGDIFGAGVTSLFKLRGDFDAQVDFRLLDWPFANGVRVGLGIPEPAAIGSAVERTSFGSSADAEGEPREVYLTDLQDPVAGIVATSDLSGTLRLVRSGNQGTGYYLDSATNTWVSIHTGPVTTEDVPINLSSWSHDFAFTGQAVRLAFDNFQINSGEMLNGPPCVPEPDNAAFLLTACLTSLGLFAARKRR